MGLWQASHRFVLYVLAIDGARVFTIKERRGGWSYAPRGDCRAITVRRIETAKNNEGVCLTLTPY